MLALLPFYYLAQRSRLIPAAVGCDPQRVAVVLLYPIGYNGMCDQFASWAIR